MPGFESWIGSGVLVAATGVWIYLHAVFIARLWLAYRNRQRRRSPPGCFRPGVTILKPLSGVDEHLESNLESFLRLNYEPLQIIFGAADPSDPGLEVARRVAARYPQRDVLFIDHNSSDAASPKIGNLETMLPQAVHPLVMLSDSNVRIDPDDLTQLVQPMQDERVGLVYQPVVGVDEQGAGATAENLRLTEYAGMLTITLKTLFFQDAVMGKGMLCRRAALESIGDMAPVRDMAADDYMLGVFIKRAGWKLHLATVPARAVHVRWSFNSFIKRHTRHAALRFRINPWAYPIELVMTPLLYACGAVAIGGWRGLGWGTLAMLIKMTLEASFAWRLRDQRLTWAHWALIPVKDAIMVYIWFAAIFSNRVHWRGRTYRMIGQSKLVPLSVSRSESNRVPQRESLRV